MLDSIRSPSDLKGLNPEELLLLASEIRQRVITATSQNGGHVGPNLGVVELTIALHLAFDSPNDSFLWDVSHQGYVHKLLTGRNDSRFDKIRNTGGYSGFLSREESIHDSFGAGHAGTALSAALGMCAARDLQNESNHVVAIAGDAAFTCGITLEALNNIATTTKKFILVINDNKWSIAKNVGAFSKYFNELITNPIYTKFHQEAEHFLKQFPGGSSFMRFISKAKRDTKDLLAPSSIFEKLGLRYLGPIDGHDISSLTKFFEFAKQSDEPVVLHVLTQKGKGFPAAMQEPEKWHGTGSFDPNNCESASVKQTSKLKFQDAFGHSILQIADKNKKVVGITAAMPSGTGLDHLAKAYPDRFFDVGIAEEHAVLMAAGMAAKGLHPVCAIYSTFLQRAYDQIIHDVCLQNLPVTFCLDRAGISPNDGPTHHGLFDISYLRCVPNAVIMQPATTEELGPMLEFAVQHNSPTFIRYPRGEGESLSEKHNSSKKIKLGKAECLKNGNKISIWALGSFVSLAEKISQHLFIHYGLNITIVNARFIKPLDQELLIEHANSHDLIITLEDNVITGGFGSSILEVLNFAGIGTKVLRLGWPDKFIAHGSNPEIIQKTNNLDFNSVMTQIIDFLEADFPHKTQLIHYN
jgi:1-deoxy-D-xylulose-5-phosphate synthase